MPKSQFLPRRRSAFTVGFAFTVQLALAATALAGDVDEVGKRLTSGRVTDRARVLAQLAKTNRTKSPEKTIEYGQEAIQLLQQFPDPRLRAEISDDVCWAYQILGRYGKAFEICETGRRLAIAVGDRKIEANSLTIIGVLHWRLGQYEQALEVLASALAINEQIGDDEQTSNVLTDLGIVYDSLGDSGEALKQFRSSLAIKRKIAQEQGIANVLNNIGTVLESRGELPAALEHYRSSQRIKQRLGDRVGQVDSLMNIGSVQLKSGDAAAAKATFRESLSLSRTIGDRSGEAETLVQLAAAQRSLGKPKQALRSVLAAAEIARTIGTRPQLRDAYAAAAGLQEALGNPAEALRFYKRSRDIQEALVSEETRRRAAELQTRLELRVKEKEIDLLKRDETIRGLQLARHRRQRNTLAGASAVLLLVLLLEVRRSRLRERSNRIMTAHSRELEALDSMVRAVNSEVSPEGLFERLLREAIDLFDGAQGGSVLMRANGGDIFRFVTVAGFDSAIFRPIRLTETEATRRYTEGSKYLGEGVYLIRRHGDLPAADKMVEVPPSACMLAMTITVDDLLQGFLVLDNLDDPDAFKESDVAQLARLREHLVAAVAKVSLLRRQSEENARLVVANAAIEEKNAELERALAEVQELGGLIPICAECKKIRDDEGYWHRVEDYLSKRSGIKFSHGLCPDCVEKLYPGFSGGKGAAKLPKSG